MFMKEEIIEMATEITKIEVKAPAVTTGKIPKIEATPDQAIEEEKLNVKLYNVNISLANLVKIKNNK